MNGNERNHVIDSLFKAANLRCTLCSKSPTDCQCWVKLTCPACHKWQMTESKGLEPLVTPDNRVMSLCPDCDPEDDDHAG